MNIIFYSPKNKMTVGIMAVVSFLYLGAALAADSLSFSSPLKSKASFEVYSNQFQSKMPLANESGYTLLEFLWAKMVDENSFLHWNNGVLFEEGDYFQPSVLEHELYKGKFKEIRYIRKKMAEKYVSKMAEKVLMETRIAKKIDKFAKDISRHMRIRYVKPTNDENALLYLPGQDRVSPFNDQDKQYEIVFSAHLYDQLPGIRFGCSMEINSNYYGMGSNLEFIPGNGEFGMEVTSHRLNNYLGGRTSLEFVTSEDDVSTMVRFSLEL